MNCTKYKPDIRACSCLTVHLVWRTDLSVKYTEKYELNVMRQYEQQFDILNRGTCNISLNIRTSAFIILTFKQNIANKPEQQGLNHFQSLVSVTHS